MIVGCDNMSSYNNGKTILLDSVDKSELNQAAIDFSEGLESLKQCLLCMWSNGLKSKACCKGYHGESTSIMNASYILMQQGSDLFSFLSSEIINSPYVELKMYQDGTQSISIYGEKRDEILHKITEDIFSGRKNNRIETKIVSSQVRVSSYVYGFKINGYSDSEIEEIYPQLVEYAKMMEEYTYLYMNYKALDEKCDFSTAFNELSARFTICHEAVENFILKKHQNILDQNELSSPKRNF